MLPVAVRLDLATIVRSTAEIREVGADHLTFRLTQPCDRIVLATGRTLLPGSDYRLEPCPEGVRVTSLKDARAADRLILPFA